MELPGHSVFPLKPTVAWYVTGRTRYGIVTWTFIIGNMIFSRFGFHFFMQLQVYLITKGVYKGVNFDSYHGFFIFKDVSSRNYMMSPICFSDNLQQ